MQLAGDLLFNFPIKFSIKFAVKLKSMTVKQGRFTKTEITLL